MIKKLAFPLALAVLLVFAIGFAGPLETDGTTIIKDKIHKGEVAEFNITVINNQDREDTLYITTKGDWDVTIRPYILEMEKFSSASVYVRVAPPTAIAKGLYGVRLAIDSNFHPGISTYKYVEVEVLDDIVAPKLEDKVDISKEFKKGFLSETYTVYIHNIGRTIVTNKYSVEQEDFASYFTAYNPDYTSAEGKAYTWDYTLSPGETFVISYTTSYQSLLGVAVLFIIALLLLARYYATDFRLEKKIYLDGKAGEPRAVRVKLSVQNLSNKEQSGIVVADIIPAPLKLTKEFGTLKPDIIERAGHNLRIIWKLDKLAPKESRVLSYQMKSRIRILGRISLPPAMLSYKKGKKSAKMFSDISAAKE